MKKAVIVLPTYNEKDNIATLIPSIFRTCKKAKSWEIHILVVDDNSPDKTALVVQKLQKKYKKLHLIQGKKQGLGKAYKKGFDWAIKNIKPFVLIEMDADWSHSPNYIPGLLEKIQKGADMVLGSRYIKGGSIPSDWGIHRKFFSVIGNYIVKFGFMNLSISDWTTGFRVIKTWVVKNIISDMDKFNGYVFQIAFLDKAIKQGARITESPIHFRDRTKGVSKINAAEYIFNVLKYIFNNSSFIKFVIVGGLGFIVDFTIAYLLIHLISFSKPIANMISAEIAIFSNFILNNFWSFSHKRLYGDIFAYIKNFITFNLISSGSIVIQGVGIALTLKYFGDYTITLSMLSVPSWIVYKMAIIVFIIIPYSYILYNKIVWTKKTN